MELLIEDIQQATLELRRRAILSVLDVEVDCKRHGFECVAQIGLRHGRIVQVDR